MAFMDINCDMGESFGTYTLGLDSEAMPYVTSINVACGFHASDPMTMQKTVKLARKYNVAIGAHPSYPDLIGFGRRKLAASPAEVKADMLYQIGALWGFCQAEGIKLQHVKAHGALYNVAAQDIAVATAIAEAIRAIDPNIYMLCLANSLMVDAAKQAGIKYVAEAFADRAYTPEGTLVPRSQPGSVIHDVNEVAQRVLSMATDKTVTAIDGTVVPICAHTICVHGDTPGAVEMIKTIRQKLEQETITVAPFGKFLAQD